MTDPALFAAGCIVLALCITAATGALLTVRRHEREERRIESEVRQMAARRRAFQASQRPPATRQQVQLPVGPGADGHAAILHLRDARRSEQPAA